MLTPKRESARVETTFLTRSFHFQHSTCYADQVELRCYLFSSCLGDLYRWYEVLADEKMRVVLVLGEFADGRWRLRVPEYGCVFSCNVFDKMGDVTRVG